MMQEQKKKIQSVLILWKIWKNLKKASNNFNQDENYKDKVMFRNKLNDQLKMLKYVGVVHHIARSYIVIVSEMGINAMNIVNV